MEKDMYIVESGEVVEDGRTKYEFEGIFTYRFKAEAYMNALLKLDEKNDELGNWVYRIYRIRPDEGINDIILRQEGIID